MTAYTPRHALAPHSAIILSGNVRLAISGQGSVNRELWDRFIEGAIAHHRATGIRTRLNSAMRSTADQWVLYNNWYRYRYQGGPWAPLAAFPGTSNHERGLALDAQPHTRPADYAWQMYFRAVGLGFPVSGEAWHIELAPSRLPLPAAPGTPSTPVPIPVTSTPIPPSTKDFDMASSPFRLAGSQGIYQWIDGRPVRIPSPKVLRVKLVTGELTPNPFAEDGVAVIGDPDEIRDLRATYGPLD